MGNLSVTTDGNRAYFWAWEFLENDEFGCDIYKGDLIDNKLTNIEKIQELSPSLYNMFSDVENDENLYFHNWNEESGLYDTYTANKEGDTYKKQSIDLGINGELVIKTVELENNQLLSITRDEMNCFKSIYLSELKEGQSTTLKEIQLPEELEGKEIYDNNSKGMNGTKVQEEKIMVAPYTTVIIKK